MRSLASVQSLFTIERSVAAIDALGAAEASRFIDTLRMRTLVSRRLADLPSPSNAVRDCQAALAVKVASLAHMHTVLQANLDRLERVARDTRLAIVAGKGLVAHARYPDASIRDFNDLDLFVGNHTDAFRLSAVLRGEFGYTFQDNELPWLKVDPSDGMVYGQIAHVAPRGAGDMLNVDVHFGDYSVRHCGRLRIAGGLTRDTSGLHLLAPEDNLACVVNNAAGDYFVTAKDTNDLLLGITAPDFDLPRFLGLIRQARLDGFLGFMIRTLRETTVLTEEQERRFREIPPALTVEPPPRPDAPSWTLRCLGTTLHAFAVRRDAGLIAAGRTAANAFSYYRKRLQLRAVPGGGRNARAAEWNPWTCVRLVPLDMATGLLEQPGEAAYTDAASSFIGGDKEFERFDTAAGMYFRIGDEFFVGTVEYDLSADVIRQARAAAAVRTR
ncbi:nucleotidyltransferase family protein [Micromonospora sediminimaris]|uniref:nucleotidyltransferase family protein n=1 Tax=Micromonospora sediminimaris TaxID=547162 RepID=UPI0037B1E263